MSSELNYSVDLINNQIADADDVDTKFDEAKTFINRLFDLQEGECINNKITATTGSNDLTVRLKTRAGSDPSSSDRVYCRIGDTILKVSSALSVTVDDAFGDLWRMANIWTNDADNHQQLFVYLINNNGTPQLGLTLAPWLTTVETNYYDAGGQTGSAATSNMLMSGTRNATNSCTVIGRINVYQNSISEWNDPTDTTIINRPIYYTDTLKCDPSMTGDGTIGYTVSNIKATFKIIHDSCYFSYRSLGTTTGSTSSSIRINPPVFPDSGNQNDFYFQGAGFDANYFSGLHSWKFTSEYFELKKYNSGNYGVGPNRVFSGNFSYKLI